MPQEKPVCFFIMPFTPDVHYHYLYLKQYIEGKHNMVCERADDRVLTIPMSNKIREMIQKADVAIADCTGRNPNVFYEIGLAHAFDRKVILLTRDSIDSVPSDIRQFEFIKYDLEDHVSFLSKLDKALDKLFENRYDEQFHLAEKYFAQFGRTSPSAKVASREEFTARYRAADATGQAISSSKLLAFIIANHLEADIMAHILEFVPEPEVPTAAGEAGTGAQDRQDP